MRQIDKRFEISSGDVRDLYSERKLELRSVSKDYLKIQYLPGFFHPYAYDEATEKMIMEPITAPKLKTDQIYEEKELLGKMLPLLMALKEVQNLGEPYGSLSPDSIYDTENGFFLADLGSGKAPEDLGDYSASECFAFRGQSVFASDVYSVCAIMYELLSGIHLPAASEREQTGSENEELEPITAFGVTEEVSAAIEKGLHIYADDRFYSIEDLTEALYTEKQREDYKSDWEISIRPFRTKEAEIAEKIEKQEFKKNTSNKEDEEDIKPLSDFDDEEEPVGMDKNKKMLLILAVVIVVFVVTYVLLSMANRAEEEGPKELEGVVVPVSNTGIDISEPATTAAISAEAISAESASIETAVSGSAITGAAITGSAMEGIPTTTEVPTDTAPEKTITPTQTPPPTTAPTQTPKKTKKPKKTPKKTKKPKKATTPKTPSVTEVPMATKKPKKTTRPKKSITLDPGGITLG